MRQLRKGKGLSQEDVAERLSIKSGKQTISNWEVGRSEPTVSDIRKIAVILDTTLSYLLEGVEPTGSIAQESKPGYILVPVEEYIDLQRRVIRQLDQEKKEAKNE